MKTITYKKSSNHRTAGLFKPVAGGLLVAVILGLCACSMPSPTKSGSSSGGGMPSTGGGMPSTGGGVPIPGESPGGGVPDPAGNSGGGSASPSGGDAGSGSQQAESGSADSLEGLDEALDESLEDFDETVLSEGNRSGTAGSESIDILSPSGTSGGVDSDEPLFEEASIDGIAEGNASVEQRAAEGAPPGADGSADQTAGQAGSNSAAQQADGEIIPIPDDIDDGQGDDIVLRQIRDAASKERDPILREKLWDEYRRIKNQG